VANIIDERIKAHRDKMNSINTGRSSKRNIKHLEKDYN